MTRDELIAALEAAIAVTDELRLQFATWCHENHALGGVTYDPPLWLVKNESPLDSLDAAVSLMPEGWWWSIDANDTPRVSVHRQTIRDKNDIHEHWILNGETPEQRWELLPLALCIAILKARADD